jgi:hypothetical protein
LVSVTNPIASKSRHSFGRWRPISWLFGSALALGAACSDDDGGEDICISGGAVDGPTEMHCREADGTPIVQAIGQCVTAAEAPAEGEGEGEEEHEEGEHEELGVFNGREADDDGCKYRASFQNSCAVVNRPVTLTLSLTRKIDNEPATGAAPANPEIYLASDETHISPSNDITAEEISPGTYEIGPVIFDRPGRWVVRFHYFETCSDVPEDSPHGHVAFNFDVPEPR